MWEGMDEKEKEEENGKKGGSGSLCGAHSLSAIGANKRLAA